MKEGSGSGCSSVRLEKDRRPFGCLILKKKEDVASNSGPPWTQKVFESKTKEKEKKKEKRPRLMMSDSESEDLLKSPLRKVINRESNVAFVKNNSLDSFKLREEFEIDGQRISCEPRISRNRFVEDGIGRKRSRMDVFEHIEDNVFDKKTLKEEYLDDEGIGIRSSRVSGSNSLIPSGYRRNFGIECSRSLTFEKRGHFNFDREVDCADKMRSEMNKDVTFCSVGSSRERFFIPCGEPIRVQGKNGVLKVMRNVKNKMDINEKTYGLLETEENVKGFRSADTSYWKAPPSHSPPFYPEKKLHEKSPSVVIKKRNLVSSCNNLSTKNNDISLRMENVGACSSKKVVMKKGERTPIFEINSPTRCKEGKVTRSHGTEKQLLRERIRRMIVNAGWKIDFRLRRNKNYHDAVYINPLGTEYWSILKAYYALQKQFEDEGSSFTPIPEELLSQLTRQKHENFEREMVMKCKADVVHKNVKVTTKRKLEDKDVKLSINGKSLKLKIKGSGMAEPAIVQRPSFASDTNILQERKNAKQSGRSLLVRMSNKGLNSDDGNFVPYTGKRTVLSWLIDMGTVPLSGKVQYMNKRRTRAMLEGWITRDGIHCGCCSKIVTVSKFEIHAGSKLRQPFQNIFLESGVSLLRCQLNAWKRQNKSERSGFHFIDFNGDDLNDDTCSICGDGGDLICCDGCPSTFHQSCLGIQMLPPGDWHCPNCSCRFCGLAGGSTGQREDVTFSELCTCRQCEEKYHQLCSQGTGTEHLDCDSLCTSFCGQKCKELFQQLQKLLGVKHDLEAGFSWTLLQRSDLELDASIGGLPQKAECNSKLAVALTVMDECFLPIIDRRSGINLIHNVLYNCGSNFNRLNYSGFYTVILERGDEIISAASVRILGTMLAEMPFIGTRHIYRRQGMCRRLLSAIESALRSLNVEKLIIPSTSEVMHTWIAVFGFKPLEESHKQEIKLMNMLIFPDTDLLQKPLLNHNLTEENVTDNSVTKATELKRNHHNMPVVIDKSDIGYSVGPPDIRASEESVVHHAHEVNNEVTSIKTGDEYDPHNMFPLCSGVTHHKKLEVETRPICSSSVDPKLQSYMEGDVNKTCEVNVGVTGAELDIHSLAETSVQHTTNMISESPNAVSGYSFKPTYGSPGQCSSDLNHHNTCEGECGAAEFCKEYALGSEQFTSDEGHALHSADIITQTQEATFVDSLQGSGVNVVCHDPESTNQPLGTVSKYGYESSGETLVHHHESLLLQKIQECAFDATSTLPCEMENEVYCKHNLPNLGDDASVLPTSKVANHTIHDVADDSCVAFTGDSRIHSSDQGSMRGTYGVEVGVAFVDPICHTFGPVSMHNAIGSASEPCVQAFIGSNRFSNPKFLSKIPDFSSDLDQNVSPGENNCNVTSHVEPNHQASGEGNAHDIHDLNSEVSGIEHNPHSIGENNIHDMSKVITKSLGVIE